MRVRGGGHMVGLIRTIVIVCFLQRNLNMGIGINAFVFKPVSTFNSLYISSH